MRDEFDATDAITEYGIFNPERVAEELDNDRVDIALLLTATMAEAGLRRELIDHLGISPSNFDELRGRATLGYYVSKCNEMEIIHESYRESFDLLSDKRNNLVHDFGYRDDLVQNDDEAEEVKDIIENCCEWFDSRSQYPR